MAKESPYGKRATLIAECEVASGLGIERIKGFDVAWHRMLEIARDVTPVSCKLIRFVRKDP